MATISGDFTAVGVSATLALNHEDDVDYTITGSFSATVQLERALTPDESSWEIVAGPFTAAVSGRYRVEAARERLRWRCVAFASGTASYTATDTDAIEHVWRDRAGNILFQLTQSVASFFSGGDEISLSSSGLTGLAATQAEQEAGTSAVKMVTPSNQQSHVSAAKAWATVTFSGGTPTLAANYNVSGINDLATGRLQFLWGTDFSSANYSLVYGVEAAGGATALVAFTESTAQAGGNAIARVANLSGTATDPARLNVAAYGDQ